MKISKSFKVEECAATDPGRIVLHHPYLDKENGVMVSTNGRAIAVVPIETEEHDASGPVSADALKAARKIKTIGEKDIATIQANGSQVLKNGQSFPRPNFENLNYPNWKQVIPSKDRPVHYRISFNPSLLMDLCKAIGAETSITLTFAPNEKVKTFDGKETGAEIEQPILVTKGGSTAYGVLMPMRLS